ncbi:energy-coupling factor ABC transporter permease [Photobacterium sp. DNB22_13_2]
MSGVLSGFQLAGFVASAVILVLGFPRDFWPKFRVHKDYQHWVLASMLVLFLLWSLKAGLADGLQVHFLALTTLALCHGWRIAALIGVIPSVLLAVFGLLPIADIGVYLVVSVIFPVWLSFLLFRLTYRYLARHVFIYIFVAAFLNGALTITAHQMLNGGVMWLSGLYSWHYIVDNYLVLTPLLLFPEALLNGMAITLLVVYQPQWVRTFHDSDYLNQ